MFKMNLFNILCKEITNVVNIHEGRELKLKV